MLYKRSVLKNFSKSTEKHEKQSFGGVVKRKDVLKDFAKFTEKNLCRSLFFNKVAGWKPETFRSSPWRCSVKQGVLKNLPNVTGKNLCCSFFLIKLQFWGPPTQVLSCKTCKHFKNNYFEEQLWVPTSKLYLKRDSNIVVFL